jgi:nitroimidazol reductase NimA-like FMN-containing flavoprotein (pyridoxamine 5'-phosphate oxidase superfamily)
MIGELSLAQIHQVLHQQLYGRLACQVNDKLYVVPVSFAFDDKYIYAHSKEGQKIDMLRKSGHACFQVDIINGLNDWRSVIIWGKYHELKSTKDQSIAMRLLEDRFGPLHVSESISRPSGGIHPPETVEKRKKAVYFRISIDEATGRFERSR